MQKQMELRALDILECTHKWKWGDKNLKELCPAISRTRIGVICNQMELWGENVTTFLKLCN